jgi:NAD(P)H-hydrate epimerase
LWKKFHGNTVLTPHPGEFAAWTGISPEELFRDPGGILLKTARERNGVILFKGCVLLIAAPDGRLGYVDGMIPALGAGGTGDLLAGFCAALAARMKAGEGKFDGYACACAAAALLIESARREGLESRFIDPLDLAEGAAKTAGSAWL